METTIYIFAIVLGVLGMLGSLLPVLPGPPLSYIGLVLLYFWGGVSRAPSSTFMWWWLGITLVVTILDYVVPAYFTRVTGGSKSAERASLVGMILGIIFFPPWGMIIGAFIFALLAELVISRKDGGSALKSAFGSFLGFLFGTGLKLIVSGVMLFYIIF